MNHRDSVAALSHCREILLRVTRGLTIDDLDWRVLPDTKTIGEMLLHVAGFEYLMTSAVTHKTGGVLSPSMWHELKGGFSREVGFERPCGVALDTYQGLLQAVRRQTLDCIDSRGTTIVHREDIDIPLLVRELARHDAGADHDDMYQRLGRGVGTSVADDGVILHGNTVDLAELLRLHETYHRGQITFEKYLRRQWVA